MNLLKVSKSINSPKLEYIENKKPLIRIELRVLKNISVVPLGQLNHLTPDISTLHKQTKKRNVHKS